jgi:transposase-like protein
VWVLAKGGATLDFYLADRLNAKAAKRFLSAALKRSRDPRVINTDKNLAYGKVIAEQKQDGLLPKETHHRRASDKSSQKRPRPCENSGIMGAAPMRQCTC